MEMQRLTAGMRKEIAALKSTRARRAAGLFTIEGTRGVLEALPLLECKMLIGTSLWFDENLSHLKLSANSSVYVAKADEIERISTTTTSQGIIGVFYMPIPNPNALTVSPDELILALDHIQDPGNLGTIVRIADWFGIKKIWATPDTADVFGPKVIQSTMGAIGRVTIIYTDLAEALSRAHAAGIPVYGTFLDGTDIYKSTLTPGGIIVMGNEGNGISSEIATLCNCRLKIPPFPPDAETVESLNVGVATAITVAEFRRQALAQPV